MIRERAFAKANLVLHVGARLPAGMHQVCSLLASLDLADDVVAEEGDGPADEVICPGVDGENLAAAALASYRRAVDGALPPLRVRIDKRIPVAAGLGGGSADAAALERIRAWHIRGRLDVEAMRDAAGALLGRHDFSSFQGSPTDDATYQKASRILSSEAPAAWLYYNAGKTLTKPWVKGVTTTAIDAALGQFRLWEIYVTKKG